MSDFSNAATDWLQTFRSNYIASIPPLDTYQQAQVLSITGGKGGVGKTSIALKMALELEKQSKKVLLIDYDVNLSNTSIKIGLPLNNKFQKFISGEITWQEMLYKRRSFHLLHGCNGSSFLFDTDPKFVLRKLIEVLTEAKNHYDYILIDSPAGINAESLILSAYADKRVIIYTPDKSSLTDSYSLMKILNVKYGVKDFHLLANRVNELRTYQRITKSLSETLENYSSARTHLLGFLPDIQANQEDFDHFFLFDRESNFHHTFTKVFLKATEKVLVEKKTESQVVNDLA